MLYMYIIYIYIYIYIYICIYIAWSSEQSRDPMAAKKASRQAQPSGGGEWQGGCWGLVGHRVGHGRLPLWPARPRVGAEGEGGL